MFSKVIVDNFTTFDHFEFDLIENKTDKKAKKIAIVYGENGIGKTCLVKTFDFLTQTYLSLVANEKMINFIGKMKERNNPDALLSSLFVSSLPEMRLKGLAKKYYKINATEDMKTVYECIVGKNKYVYTMQFNKDGIVQEKLLCNGIIVFSCNNKDIELPESHFLSREMNDRLTNLFNMYFGEKYTFLACLCSTRRNIVRSYFNHAFSKELIKFLDMLNSMTVVTKDLPIEPIGYGNDNYSQEFLSPIVSGEYNERIKNKLKKTEVALSMFFSSLYSNIHSLTYSISTEVSGKQTYHLNFIENNCGKRISVPYEKESTGTRKLVSLFTSLYEISKNNSIIVIDEIDNGINDILLKAIFESLEDNICGQLIITTHNTLLLKHSIRKYIYLLDRDDEQNVCSYSLDEFGRKIQSKTDIIGQYIKGLYGGVPQTGAFSMSYIVEALKDYE